MDRSDEDLPPITVSAHVLLGSMPDADEALKDEVLQKLTSKYEWKEMRVVLDEDWLYLARKDEDVVRDLIPLLEITKIRKNVHNDTPSPGEDCTMDLPSSSALASRVLRANPIGSLFDEEDDGNLCVIQIETINSG